MYKNSYPKAPKRPKRSPAPLKRTAMKRKRKVTGEAQMFREISAERKHICEWCKCDLPSVLQPINFDHIIEKSKSPALRLVKSNIRLLCKLCHATRHYGTKKQIAERIAMGNKIIMASHDTQLDIVIVEIINL